MMKPRDCEDCDCQQWHWDGKPSALTTNPAEHCECGHLTSHHRFALTPEEADALTPEEADAFARVARDRR